MDWFKKLFSDGTDLVFGSFGAALVFSVAVFIVSVFGGFFSMPLLAVPLLGVMPMTFMGFLGFFLNALLLVLFVGLLGKAFKGD